MQSSNPKKNKFEKAVHLVGFIIRKINFKKSSVYDCTVEDVE